MHTLTAGSCSDGPCPDLTHDAQRGKTGGQGYIPNPADLPEAMRNSPPGEVRWEMDDHVFEQLLASHLTDAAIERILAMRRDLAAVS